MIHGKLAHVDYDGAGVEVEPAVEITERNGVTYASVTLREFVLGTSLSDVPRLEQIPVDAPLTIRMEIGQLRRFLRSVEEYLTARRIA